MFSSRDFGKKKSAIKKREMGMTGKEKKKKRKKEKKDDRSLYRDQFLFFFFFFFEIFLKKNSCLYFLNELFTITIIQHINRNL